MGQGVLLTRNRSYSAATGARVSRSAGIRGAIALHELGHWTGHPTRLTRDIKSRLGSVAYAMEELHAELASAFVASELSIPTGIPQHASYINEWIKPLKNDKREIFRAAAGAQKIVDMVLGFHTELAAKMALDSEPQPPARPSRITGLQTVHQFGERILPLPELRVGGLSANLFFQGIEGVFEHFTQRMSTSSAILWKRSMAPPFAFMLDYLVSGSRIAASPIPGTTGTSGTFSAPMTSALFSFHLQ